MMSPKLPLCTAAYTLFALAQFAAADTTWTGVANDHIWNTPTNWTAGLPTPGAAAFLTPTAGSDNVTFNGDYASPLSQLTLDAPAGFTLSQSANTMAATSELLGTSAAGIYLQSGGINAFSTLTLGNSSAGTGLYALSGGTLTGATIAITTGTLTLSGGTTSVTSTTVDNGILNISGGNHALGALSFLDTAPRLHWTGGTLSLSSGLLLDDNLTLNNAQVGAITGGVNVGLPNIAANNAALVFGVLNPATLSQSGASTLTLGTIPTPRNFYILPIASNTSGYTISNPLASLAVSGNAYLGGDAAQPSGGNAFFSILAGSVTISGTILLHNQSTLTLAGGLLSTAGINTGLSPSDRGTFLWTAGNLLLNGNLSGPASLTVPLNSNLAGSGEIAPTLLLNGTLHPTGPLALHGTTTGPGTILLGPSATLTADALQVNALTLATGATVTLRPAAGTSQLTALSLPGAPAAWLAAVEIANNPLILQATANKSTTLSTLQNQITYGTTHPNGITSTTTAADPTHKTTVAIDNALLHLTLFGGQPVNDNSLLIESTWYGDSNLDRKVNVTDLGVLATFYGTPVPNGILQGDFNNDGLVNVTDLGLLATNYGAGTTNQPFTLDADPSLFTLPNPPLPTPIPEPASLLLLLPALLLPRRR